MSIISAKQFDKKLIGKLIMLAIDIRDNPSIYKKSLEDVLLANLFFEPSTRTSASFQAAIMKLGGQVIQFNLATSSIKKKESVDDTITVMGKYADILVIRHPDANILKDRTPSPTSSKKGYEPTKPIIINAGDGSNEHPTQALLDLLTIYECNKNGPLLTRNSMLEGVCNGISFNSMNITIIGDLKYGRTVHSLIYLLLNYDYIKFNLVSPVDLCLPFNIKEAIKASSCKFVENTTYDQYISDTDILYMTRIQKERFSRMAKNTGEDYYQKIKDSYHLQLSDLKNIKTHLIILHPLPRVNEIAKEVDKHRSAKYFFQVEMGLYMRMAVLYNSYKAGLQL